MSYRTTINGSQLFGNNEFYGEWIDYIKSQGIKIDGNGNYKGEITDFMSALTVIENITMRLHHERICNQNTNLFTTPGHVYCFKLKPGETIKVEAH